MIKQGMNVFPEEISTPEEAYQAREVIAHDIVYLEKSGFHVDNIHLNEPLFDMLKNLISSRALHFPEELETTYSLYETHYDEARWQSVAKKYAYAFDISVESFTTEVRTLRLP